MRVPLSGSKIQKLADIFGVRDDGRNLFADIIDSDAQNSFCEVSGIYLEIAGLFEFNFSGKLIYTTHNCSGIEQKIVMTSIPVRHLQFFTKN